MKLGGLVSITYNTQRRQDYDPDTYEEQFNSAFLDEETPVKEYVKDEYRPTPVSRYHSPRDPGTYCGPKNRPTILGQSRPFLGERGRPRTRDSQRGICTRYGQELNRGRSLVFRGDSRTPFYTPSTQQYGSQQEDNRDIKNIMEYGTPGVVDRGARPQSRGTREPWGRNEGNLPDRSSKVTPLPKSLKYDGKSNWQAFYAKFSRFAEVSGWSAHECRDQLCWCLKGKASEHYALIVERNRNVEYEDLVQKFEKRFGFKELPETAQVEFQNLGRH